MSYHQVTGATGWKLPARLAIYGPCLCMPWSMSLVVEDRHQPGLIMSLALGLPVNPYGYVIDVSHLAGGRPPVPPTTE